MDEQILALCAEHEITYTRFVDDLGFSSHKDFEELVPTFIDIINKAGFYIGYNKTYYKMGRIILTGVDIGQNVLRPPQILKDKYADPSTPEPTRRGLGYYFAGLKPKNKPNKNGK